VPELARGVAIFEIRIGQVVAGEPPHLVDELVSILVQERRVHRRHYPTRAPPAAPGIRMADIEPLRDFIRRQFLFDEGASLGDGDPLFPEVIDSLGVMEVVAFLEEKYDVSIEEDDLLADNFRSLDAMSGLVDRKQNAG
jgi:acyl carrier protein